MQPVTANTARANELLEQLVAAAQQPAYTMPVFQRQPEQVQAVEIEVEPGIIKRDKPSPELQKALDWLAAPEHREDYRRSSRDLGRLIGVSHTWVAKAKKMMEGRE